MKTYLTIILLLGTQLSFAQKGGNKDDYKRMIDSAISIISNSYFSSAISRLDTIAILKEDNSPWPIIGLNLNSNLISINIFDSTTKKKIVDGRGLDAWKLFPNLEGNKMKISIAFFVITLSNNEFYFSNGGAARVVFTYSCKKRKWVFQEYKISGI